MPIWPRLSKEAYALFKEISLEALKAYLKAQQAKQGKKALGTPNTPQSKSMKPMLNTPEKKPPPQPSTLKGQLPHQYNKTPQQKALTAHTTDEDDDADEAQNIEDLEAELI